MYSDIINPVTLFLSMFTTLVTSHQTYFKFFRSRGTVGDGPNIVLWSSTNFVSRSVDEGLFEKRSIWRIPF